MNESIKVNRQMILNILPQRDDSGNKGSFGCLLSVCGSRDMTGAACLSSMAALRCGIGLLALASVPEVLSAAKGAVWEAIYIPLEETIDGRITDSSKDRILSFARASAMLAGCGIGKGIEGTRLLYELIEGSELPIIVDADGLNCLADRFPDIGKRQGDVVITPHIGEMSRLIKRDISVIKADPSACASYFAREKHMTVVLKDSVTHIASPDGKVYMAGVPNSGMAKGGSGDVLAGCIGSFLAQGLSGIQAALLGVTVHSAAGLMAAEKMGKYGMLPRDVIEMLPYAIKELEERTV
ncbi:MAG: NAD(P)H-hydrate dehydratase [Clostridiaceae bacterium]|nr:NAD(P)H-hydrate dehydratase [Clostridiaceae bacterium]